MTEYNRKRRLRYEYNLTLEEYDQMFDKQDGICAICGNRNKADMALAVDHDHETGFIRGLLCQNCNLALGLVRDNVLILLKMIEYLEKTRDAEDMQVCRERLQ